MTQEEAMEHLKECPAEVPIAYLDTSTLVRLLQDIVENLSPLLESAAANTVASRRRIHAACVIAAELKERLG